MLGIVAGRLEASQVGKGLIFIFSCARRYESYVFGTDVFVDLGPTVEGKDRKSVIDGKAKPLL